MKIKSKVDKNFIEFQIIGSFSTILKGWIAYLKITTSENNIELNIKKYRINDIIDKKIEIKNNLNLFILVCF